jgi:hypothetical protein
MNGKHTRTGCKVLKLKGGPFPKVPLQAILQQGDGSSGASVRCLDAASEAVGEILAKDGNEPVVQNLSETQLTTNLLGSNATDVSLQGASTSSIPAEGGRDR